MYPLSTYETDSNSIQICQRHSIRDRSYSTPLCSNTNILHDHERHRRRNLDHARHTAGLVVEPKGTKHQTTQSPSTSANRIQIFPWDNDLDVQISEATIHFLADYYNMTEHHFDIPGVNGGRSYMLEINPNYVVKSEQDYLNKIDARWIDMSSGLFIDITAVRKDEEKRSKGNAEALTCKDKHHYDVCDPTGVYKIVLTPFRRVISFHCAKVSSKASRSRYHTLIHIFLKRNIVPKHLRGRALLGMSKCFLCLLALLTGSSHTFNEHSKIWEVAT